MTYWLLKRTLKWWWLQIHQRHQWSKYAYDEHCLYSLLLIVLNSFCSYIATRTRACAACETDQRPMDQCWYLSASVDVAGSIEASLSMVDILRSVLVLVFVARLSYDAEVVYS